LIKPGKSSHRMDFPGFLYGLNFLLFQKIEDQKMKGIGGIETVFHKAVSDARFSVVGYNKRNG